jgi:hypothetical protein
MARPKTADIDPHTLARDLFNRLGGIDGMTRWAKNKQTLAYQLIAHLMKQPASTTFNKVTIKVNDGEAARRKLEDALLRQIDARRFDSVDPVVTVNGERIVDQSPVLTHDAVTRDPRPATDDAAPGSDFENLKSPNSGSPFDGSRVGATPGEGKKNQSVYSKPIPSIPGVAAGVALDGSDENKSSTQLFYEWKGHGKPP